jgi:anti-anti-sigma factor
VTVGTLDEPRVGGDGRLEVSFRAIGDVCVLTLRGALEADSVAVLESLFDRLWRTPCRRVVLDLHALGAIDETGANVLTGLHHYVEARGGSVSVVGTRPWVAEALGATPLVGSAARAPGTPRT